MPAVDLLNEWRRSEAACVAAYRAMYAKVKFGMYITESEMAEVARLSRVARERYHQYREHVAATEIGVQSRKSDQA